MALRKAAIILAAGMGTRMKSATPKVLHKIAGKPILGHVIAAARGAGATTIVVVTSPDGQAVRDYATSEGAQSVVQNQQLGTGHAANCAASALKDFSGVVAVTYGDMPLLTSKTFEASYAARENAGMAIIAFEAKDPAAYGRVILDRDGMLDRIVEFKDANPTERAVALCNAGLLAADAKSFFRWASQLKNDNAQREYYLTDIPLLARDDQVACAVARTGEEEVMGVNSRAELAVAEAVMQRRLRAHALDGGVGMIAPETVYLCARHGARSRCADRALCGVRPRRHGTWPARDQSVLPSGRRRSRPRRADRALCAAAPRRADRGERPYRQFRGSEEHRALKKAPRPII